MFNVEILIVSIQFIWQKGVIRSHFISLPIAHRLNTPESFDVELEWGGKALSFAPLMKLTSVLSANINKLLNIP